MQMTMVLRDVGILSMDLDSYNTAVRPKIEGTWNLLNLLRKDMDLFVLFSSVCGMFGYYGQSNCPSANTFLDSFVQYHQDPDFAASVFDIRPVDDVGYDTRTPATRMGLAGSFGTSANGAKFAGYFAAGYRSPIDHIRSAKAYPALLPQQSKDLVSEGTEAADHLKQQLSSMASDPSKLDEKSAAGTIAGELGNCVLNFLMEGDEEIDRSSTLAAVGVGSLKEKYLGK